MQEAMFEQVHGALLLHRFQKHFHNMQYGSFRKYISSRKEAITGIVISGLYVSEFQKTDKKMYGTSLKMKMNESFQDLLTALRSLLANCEYLEDDVMVRDRIVLGLNSDKKQEVLLQKSDLALLGAINICRRMKQTFSRKLLSSRK